MKNVFYKFLTIYGMFALAADSTYPSFTGIDREVNLRADTETWSQEVCLGDLVDEAWVKSRCMIEKKLCCKWNMGGNLVKELTRQEITKEISKIEFSGVGIKIADQCKVGVVSIKQTRRELRADEIQKKIIEAVTSKFATKASESEVKVSLTSIKLPVPVYVNLDSESDWEVRLPEVIAEKLSVKIVSTIDSRPLGWVQTAVSMKVPALVAKKTIRPSEPIRPEDFEVRLAESIMPAASGSLMPKVQLQDGVRARVSILPGTALKTSMIERMPTVQLGDVVTLILRSDSMRISTKGVAQGSAAIGDTVSVQLSRYNKTFRGKLLESKTVEVWF